jgi:TRAP-type C4-dicarboxylate transport system permease small subunit
MRLVLRAAQRLGDLIRWAQWLVVFAASIIIVALICTIVVLRYVFEMDLYGMEELAVFVGIWLFFIGASYASQQREQISADVIPQYLRNPAACGGLELLTTIVSLGVCVLAAYWAWDWLSWGLERPARSPVHDIPMTVTHTAVLASFILMSVFTLRDVVVRGREFVKLVAPRPPRR